MPESFTVVVALISGSSAKGSDEHYFLTKNMSSHWAMWTFAVKFTLSRTVLYLEKCYIYIYIW